MGNYKIRQKTLRVVWRRIYNDDMGKLLGRKLMASRIEAGFKRVEEIAPLVDRKPRMIRHYEAGDTEPRHEFIRRWAEVVGKPIEYFSEEPPRSVPNTYCFRATSHSKRVFAPLWPNPL